MPVNLTENDEFTANVSVPLPLEAGSIAEGGPLRSGIQALANRTRHFYNRFVAGVKRVQFFSDIASLQAVTGQSAGDVALAIDSLGRLGIYHYSLSFSGANILPYVVKPAALADGDPGRWVHLFHHYGAFDTDVSGNNKWTYPGPGRVVEVLESIVSSPSSSTYNSGGSWQDTGLSITKTLILGDVVSLTATTVWAATEAEGVQFRLRVDAPGGSATLDGGPHELDPSAANQKNLAHVTGKWTAGESGSHTFKLQILVDAGGPFDAILYAQRAMHGLWIRP